MSFPLTEKEFHLLQDASLLPAKFRIGEKINKWLAALHRELKTPISNAIHLSEEVCQSSGKISRGENYHNQAYRVLDYPRIFRRDAIFAFRTVVLWGHPIGFHLILSGIYKEKHQEHLLTNRHKLGENVCLAAHETPWIWEADAPGLHPCHAMSEEDWREHLDRFSFIKLSQFLPLTEYEHIASKGTTIWTQWSQLL
ncbi:MAG: hypothetical protein AAF587_37975 [Bacteroidota bacterium]